MPFSVLVTFKLIFVFTCQPKSSSKSLLNLIKPYSLTNDVNGYVKPALSRLRVRLVFFLTPSCIPVSASTALCAFSATAIALSATETSALCALPSA